MFNRRKFVSALVAVGSVGVPSLSFAAQETSRENLVRLCEELGLLLGLQFLRQPLGFFFGALSLLFQSQGERGLLFGDQVSFVFGIKFPGLLQDLALCWPS